MPGNVCTVTHERASVVRVEKHLGSNKKKIYIYIKKKAERNEMSVRREETTNKPRTKRHHCWL